VEIAIDAYRIAPHQLTPIQLDPFFPVHPTQQLDLCLPAAACLLVLEQLVADGCLQFEADCDSGVGG